MTAPAALADALASHYRFDRELGAGGMATVYLAHDHKHGREVAIKVLRANLAETLGRDRFLREIQLAARLNHPHILPLYDSGEAAGFLYFVMPVMKGQTLRDRLAQEPVLPVDEAIRLSIAVADALDYAHRHDIVHRDIKPENILLHEGHAVVSDFGIG
jgi:eukaryotic-like serine/threonine-protein kinase